MKFIHLSDLHLGKRVNGFSMLEDQKYILTEIINIIDTEKPNAVIIAGDVYDKSVPPAEAVEMLDEFLVCLAKRNLQVFIISGNHDSPERLAFGNRLIDVSGIHISPVYNGEVKPISLQDEYGIVNIYMLPFIKPVNVRRYFPDEDIATYTDAMRLAVNQMNIDTSNRNILITHQFVTGALRSDSEDISVGGSDNIDVSAFKGFDYIALGHIHRPQNIGSECVRYCGTPLKYSFSEAKHKKSVTIIELHTKDDFSVRTVPLTPIHDMVVLKGTYADITNKSYYENTSWQEDYVHITLTDEEDIPDAIGKLRTIYHNLMEIKYDNKRTQYNAEINGTDTVKNKTPLELFKEFYELQNNSPMSAEQISYMQNLIENVWEEES